MPKDPQKMRVALVVKSLSSAPRPRVAPKTAQTLDFIDYRGVCPQSYRVTGTGERVMEMLAGKIFAPAFRAPPPAPARYSAPFRVLSRFSARVVLALRATTKRGTSDAPGELASISVAAVLFVSRVGELSCPAREAATKVAMRCGAQGETQSQAPGRRRASRLRSNPPRRGRRSWSRGAPLSPRGWAVDESVAAPSIWNDVWQLALCRKGSRDVLIV